MGLTGKKLLIVGGSAGIGREAGVAAVKGGADVVFAARRADKLDEVVAQAGGGHAVTIDVRDEATIGTGIEQAVSLLGGLDALILSAGMARLRRLEDQTAADWHELLETNLIGAALVARAAIPRLAPTNGVMLFCSSTADDQPRWGLSGYGVTKAALNRLVDALRAEHRDVRFVRAIIGSTIGTEFGNNFDGEILMEAFAHWVVGAQHTANMMTPEELGSVLISLVDTLLSHPGVDIPHISLEPPGGPFTLPATPDMAMKAFEAMAPGQ